MTRRATGVLLAWAAIVALCIVVIVRTPFTADLSAFLPAKPDPRQQVLIEQLHSGVAARTLLIGIESGIESGMDQRCTVTSVRRDA